MKLVATVESPFVLFGDLCERVGVTLHLWSDVESVDCFWESLTVLETSSS